jgi:hypothetical protein
MVFSQEKSYEKAFLLSAQQHLSNGEVVGVLSWRMRVGMRVVGVGVRVVVLGRMVVVRRGGGAVGVGARWSCGSYDGCR